VDLQATELMRTVAGIPEQQLDPGMYHADDGVLICVPMAYGPTWRRNPDWDGVSKLDEFVLPERTLGWQALRWISKNLLDDETDAFGNQLPWKPTNEQMRFILWFYALDEEGSFLFREIVLQRLKGWGKDPLAAAISMVEFVGPCRFSHWATEDMPHLGLAKGDPVGKQHPRAWIQVAAVNQEQTKNTMKLLKGFVSKKCMDEHSIDDGILTWYAYHGQRTIEAVTSSPRALEGGRATLIIKNETHQWVTSNGGHDMADVIERNATKSKDGAARTLSITNAYQPSESSVAQVEREAWEAEQADDLMSSGTMYDSLEAPPDAKLRPPTIELEGGEKLEPTNEEIIDNFRAVLEAVRGDSWWLSVVNMTKSILNRKNKPSRSRRFWFNQIVGAEDAWANPQAILKAAHPDVMRRRQDPGHDPLHVGWDEILPSDEVVLFGDGSKNDDSTAIVGCRLSDGYLFTVGVWEKPPGKRGENWLAPRTAVTARVNEATKRFNVIAFWFDPSHTKDDEEGSRYWDSTIDGWFQKRRETLNPLYWPLKSGHNKHGILWDMAGPANRKMFVGGAEAFLEDLHRLDDIEEFDPAMHHDGHPLLMQHMRQAVEAPTDDGMSLMKENRESAKKIDLAVCAVGAHMLRRIVLNTGLEEEEEGGEIWGAVR
jgi:hypothetical protein